MTQLIGPPVPGHEADENEAVAVFTERGGDRPALREALREKGLPLDAVEDMPLLVRGDAQAVRLTFPPFPPKPHPFARSSRAA